MPNVYPKHGMSVINDKYISVSLDGQFLHLDPMFVDECTHHSIEKEPRMYNKSHHYRLNDDKKRGVINGQRQSDYETRESGADFRDYSEDEAILLVGAEEQDI